MEKKTLKTSDPNYHKNYYEKNKEKIKELKKEKNQLWRLNNKEKIKELNKFHKELRKIKLIEKRKKELNYDNYEWFLIPNIKDPYYINKNNIIINKTYKTIKIYTNKLGYEIVSLSGKPYMFHRIIAIVFIPNPLNKKEINHINGIKNDNRIENLEWVTRSENVKHSFDVLNKKSNLINWRSKKLIKQ